MVYGQDFIPGPRVGQAAVLVENNIFYIGGFNFLNKSESLGSNPTSDFFYFYINTTGYFWTDLESQGVNIPLTVWHTANIGGINKDSIFIIGGVHFDETNTNYIYRFDAKTNAIDIPVIQGKAPIMRRGVDSVSYEGNIYMFGGQIGSDNNVVFPNNLFDILDTVNLNWQVGSLVNSPVTRSQYTATLVNGIIYYIGGISGLYNFSPMTEIYQYDIVGNKWSLKTATATVAVAMPGSRVGHSASLGNFTDKPNIEDQTNKLIYVFDFLDLNNVKWFTGPLSIPNPINNESKSKSPIPPPPDDIIIDPSQDPYSSKIVIVGISIGSVAIGLAVLVAIILVYKRTKKNR
ncbi:hypothetical protein C1645_737919 [Glomus cerebriforme]|uniref:Galactose oxidase n=1 Tax=Glomus cerebriforme TaxID=658196 RepID=A0A397T5N6_9GLOM|nr:hypothetical protein C1645_737919 [Glomus cerebriforme]